MGKVIREAKGTELYAGFDPKHNKHVILGPGKTVTMVDSCKVVQNDGSILYCNPGGKVSKQERNVTISIDDLC